MKRLALITALTLFAVVPQLASAADLEVAITAPTAGTHSLSGIVPVTVTASALQGIYNVQLEVDGTPYGPPDFAPAAPYTYTFDWDTSGLTPGDHTLTALATDWSSGGVQQRSNPVTVDVGPAYPTVSLTFPRAWSFARATTQLASSVSGGVAPVTVSYAVDAVPLASPLWNTTTVSDGSHTVSVTVTDARGKSATDSVPVSVDNTPPSTAVVAPAANGYFTDSVRASANASDAFGIASVQFLIDGKPVAAPVTSPDATSGYTYSQTLSLAGLAPGAHTLTEVATDAAGNTTTSAPVTFNVGAALVTTALTAPANWSFATKTATVTAGVTGGSAPFSLTLQVDGQATSLVSTLATAAGTASFAWNTATVTDGAHTLSVVVTDAAGKTATSALVQVTVDNTAPTAVMYQPTAVPGFAYARSNGPTTFQVHASDVYGIKSVQFTVDGNPMGPALTSPDTAGGYLYSLSYNTSTLAPGLHSISAVVTDSVGNATKPTSLSLKSGPVQYVPVLNYHGITGPLDPDPDIYDQSPAEADAQLAYLHTNGYQSITVEQYQTWLQTGTLPAGVTKPVLITVDDALTDELAWDPLLQKYGFTAVLYVVTGFADNKTPGANDPKGNMSWAQIQTLATNGRWEIAFHAGLDGHGDFSDAGTSIKLGKGQVQTYAPTCFAYYNCLGTITTTTTTTSGGKKTTKVTTAAETPAQFESQVTAEVTAGMSELKQKVPTASMVSWACPWNACGQWTTFYNDPSNTLEGWMPNFFASLFPIVFTQTDPVTYGSASGNVGPLNGDNRHYRFEVHTDTTLQDFATALTDPGFANN